MLNLIRRSISSSLFSLPSKITRFKRPNASSSISTYIYHRSYYTNRRQLHHFLGNPIPRWYQNPGIVAAVLLAGGGTALAIYYGNIETVPYTKRSHFILLSYSLERRLGEARFNKIKSSLRGKIVQPPHPDSIRVGLISKQIIEAMQRGFCHEDRQWEEVRWRKEEEEVVDDELVRDSREKGKEWESTRHLEGLSWEVVVVRDEKVNAMCLPGGKIIVFTGLLDQLRNDDAEIATVIGHEVGCYEL